jgi:hypothetical protein
VNNVVDHGKSRALLDALESVLGVETFEAVYRRILREYAGRRLEWRGFQRIAEVESEQDLGWFFEQWVRSSRNVDYRVAGQQCSADDGAIACTVRIERTGAMYMPVTVAARFEDGSEQRARTERLADVDELTFVAKSPLKQVVIDPDFALAMAAAPSAAERALRVTVSELPWTGAGESAVVAYREARTLQVDDPAILLKLGLTLYDGRNYEEALEALATLGQSDRPHSRFVALVWQGHVLDLLGRRGDAVARYEQALNIPGSPSIRHDQYRMVINREWVQIRLKTPFERP